MKNKEKNTPEISVQDIWNEDKSNKLKDFILQESKKQSQERRIRNEILSIKYKIEDYIENEEIEKEMKMNIELSKKRNNYT